MGRLISDRMSYRNHYMCSGHATSTYYFITHSYGSGVSDELLNRGIDILSLYYFNANVKMIISLLT